MYFIALLFLAPFAQAFDPNFSNIMRSAANLITKQPVISSVTMLDPPGFHVEWLKVEPLAGEEAVLGYKLRIWEMQKKDVYHYVVKNGNPVLVKETEQANNWPKFLETLPPGEYKEFILNSEDSTDVKVQGLKPYTWYEIRVLAFSKSGDGPISNAVRAKIGEDN